MFNIRVQYGKYLFILVILFVYILHICLWIICKFENSWKIAVILRSAGSTLKRFSRQVLIICLRRRAFSNYKMSLSQPANMFKYTQYPLLADSVSKYKTNVYISNVILSTHLKYIFC